MKKLIVIQNDYSGSGKTALARSLGRYLTDRAVSHQILAMNDENLEEFSDVEWLDPSQISVGDLLARIDANPITILDIGTGVAEFFGKFFVAHELDHLLAEVGVELTVMVPVTSDADSFEAVTAAAEIYSDNVQYVIAHLVTSSYEDDDKAWDTSYAARVMDMFDSVEMYLPEVGFMVEQQLRVTHTDLATALGEADLEGVYGKEMGRWFKRVEGQFDGLREYLFGEWVRRTVVPAAPTRRRKASSKAD